MDVDTSAAIVVTFQPRSSLKGLASTLGNERPCWPFSHFPWTLQHEGKNRSRTVQRTICCFDGTFGRRRTRFRSGMEPAVYLCAVNDEPNPMNERAHLAP
jgi:hypothetical protein